MSAIIAMSFIAIPVQAQVSSERSSTVRKAAPLQAQDFRDPGQMVRKIADSKFIERQHSRLKCGQGEKKQLIVQGKRDSFSSSGSEQTNVNSRVPVPTYGGTFAGRYDHTRTNDFFMESLNIPANVTSGRLMIGLKGLGGQQDTDSMYFGNLSAGSTNKAGYNYTGQWNTPGWSQSGSDHVANFSSISLQSGQTLESYIISSGDTVIDSIVQDDHSVDYLAASVCVGPEKKGMTWGLNTPIPEPVNGVAHFACKIASGDCNPYTGDTICKTALPILCINPMGLTKPANLTEGKWNKWSGGILGTTAPTAAPSKLSDANNMCVKEFGTGWRVAQHHDSSTGRSGWAFSGYGNAGTMGKRFWTDIDNQPKGVCWDRSQ